MKKILLVLSFLIISLVSFGKINDELALFNEEAKTKIEEQAQEILKNRGLHVYVNTFLGDEGFVPEKSERLIILNIKKINEKNFKVELKLTKDIELDEIQESINDILVINEKYLKDKDIVGYVVETLSGVNNLLENVKIEEPIVVEEDIVEEKKNGFFIGMGIAFFLIFAIILRVLMVKYRRSLNEEIDIISRKK